MFGKFKSMLMLSESSFVLKEAILSITIGTPNFDIDTLSTRVVSTLYNSKHELFDGKMGKRPHAISTAAAALAQGIRERPAAFSDEIDASMALALGQLLLSASAHSSTYGFSNNYINLLN